MSDVPRALSAEELSLATAALDRVFGGATVLDVARLRDRDDLVLFLGDPPDSGDERPRRRGALHIALGSRRARLTRTRRRFARGEFATGPLVDRIASRLAGARLVRVEQPDVHERRASLRFRTDPEGERDALTLVVELFGNRGYWCLCDASGVILEASRLPDVRDRTLRPGVPYEPPQSAPPPRTVREPRFGNGSDDDALLDAIDEHFTPLDRSDEREGETARLLRLLDRAAQRADQRARGLERQLASMARAPELRRDADLLLAYGFALPPDATEVRAPDPNDPTREVVVRRVPGQPVQVQADKLYQKARKYEDGVVHTREQAAAAARERDGLAEHATALRAAPDDDTAIGAARRLLEDRGLDGGRPSHPRPTRAKQKQGPGTREDFRRFVSREGLPIFVGRNNAQNDRLSIRFARGNDLWFHVGGGYAGSHVVLRLDKNRLDVGLESLLDAGTLAVYYSKVRGAELCEVIYTRAKHVTKPKGLPPGRVLATQTKDLRIRIESERLERLLGSGRTEDAQ